MENYISIFQKRRRFVAFFLIFMSALFAARLMRGGTPTTASLPSIPRVQTQNRTFAALLGEGVPSSLPRQNKTNEIIQKYGAELRRLNADKAGQAAVTPSEIATPSEQFLEGMLSKEVAQNTLVIPLLAASDVLVVSSTPELVQEYGRAYERISSQNISGNLPPYLTAAYEALLGSRPASLRAHVRAASSQVADLRALAAPETLLPLHLELLNIWNRRAVIGETLLDTTDPLGQVLALNSLTEAMEKENEVVAFFASFSQKN